MAGLNSQWRSGRPRGSLTKKIDDSRWVKSPNGHWRLVEDSVSERVWLDRRREQAGWRGGARLRQ